MQTKATIERVKVSKCLNRNKPSKVTRRGSGKKSRFNPATLWITDATLIGLMTGRKLDQRHLMPVTLWFRNKQKDQEKLLTKGLFKIQTEQNDTDK